MKLKPSSLLPLSLLMLSSAISSQAQQWAGIISPSRAVDWTQAGIPGGIPSSGWTQCGPTIAPYSGSADAINTAIRSCGTAPNSYIQLGAGTFNLSTGINLWGVNQVEVRGMGADKTFIVPTGGSNNNANYSCNGLDAMFCLAGGNSYLGGEQNNASWRAGYSQGATSLTLSNSLNITPGSTIINLDQQDEIADTGNVWNCLGGPCGGFPGGGARTDNNCSSSVSPNVGYCSQQQQVLVTACSPSCNSAAPTVVSISPGIYMNNWRASQNPGAWWATQTAYRKGVQNLSVDLTALAGAGSSVVIDNCYQCWTRGIRSIAAGRNHIWIYDSSHAVVRDNYLYQAASHGSQSYGIEIFSASSDDLVENNICNQITDGCPNNTGGGAGSVGAFNFSVNDTYGAPGWMQVGDYDHASGYDYWLREGNIDMGVITDNVHGTHHFTTLFRNYYSGWQSLCGGVACNAQTIPIHLYAASRYFNIVGNVLGQPGYHTTYNCVASGTSCPNAAASVYVLGYTGNNGGVISSTTGFCLNSGCTSRGAYDPLTASSLLRWGNYDVVHNAAQFSSAEVPSSFGDTTGSPSIYANTVPSSQALPASLHYASKPGWWPASVQWPPIGPDVSGGNVTAGSGPAASLGGHVFMNPAMNCFVNLMGGRADGTGGVLSFNADNCYSSSVSQTPLSPPTGLSAIVQ